MKASGCNGNKNGANTFNPKSLSLYLSFEESNSSRHCSSMWCERVYKHTNASIRSKLMSCSLLISLSRYIISLGVAKLTVIAYTFNQYNDKWYKGFWCETLQYLSACAECSMCCFDMISFVVFFLFIRCVMLEIRRQSLHRFQISNEFDGPNSKVKACNRLKCCIK